MNPIPHIKRIFKASHKIISNMFKRATRNTTTLLYTIGQNIAVALTILIASILTLTITATSILVGAFASNQEDQINVRQHKEIPVSAS